MRISLAVAAFVLLIGAPRPSPSGQKAIDAAQQNIHPNKHIAKPSPSPTPNANEDAAQNTADQHGGTVKGSENERTVRVVSIPRRGKADYIELACTIALTIAGIVGIIVAICTLRTLKKQTRAIRIQGIHMARQTRVLQRQARATEDSVKVASDNTKVLIDVERAWLIPSGPVSPKSLPTYRLAPVQTELLVVKIKNFGRTPAWLTDYFIDFEILDNTNIEEFTHLQNPEADYPSARPVPSGKTEEFSKEWNIRDSSTLDDIQAGRKHLYVYGYVQYRTAMTKELSCSYFCFHYFRQRSDDGNFMEGWMLEPPTANRYT